MKKHTKENSPKNKELLKQAPATSQKKDKQGGKNPEYPQEYEEQLGAGIRMKPQPYSKPEK